jgi:hypothetical protein
MISSPPKTNSVLSNTEFISNDEVFQQKIVLSFRNYIAKLQSWPKKKQKILTCPQWFEKTYKLKVASLQETLSQFPAQKNLLSSKLSTLCDLPMFLLKGFIRQKLLLRQFPRFAEFPPLAKEPEIYQKVILPAGLAVNQDAIRFGVYSISPAEQKILDSARTLFVKVTFAVGEPSKSVTIELELDFVMSCPAYSEACLKVFERDIINVNVRESKLAFKKHYAQLLYSMRSRKKDV